MLENLRNPKFYGPDVKSVRILQTHISYVALTGKYAYKVKKPVDFGFLDFTSLEKRKFFCEEEVRLNRRLCNIYLGVVPITQKNNTLSIDGEGEVIDYAVKMKEFPQDRIMTNQLKKGKVKEETIEKICDILVEFYKSGDRSAEIDSYGKIHAIRKNIEENFEQTKNVIGIAIKREVYDYIRKASHNFMDKKEIFEERVKEGYIRDCHGDLHSGNIVVMPKEIYIFDCIEFNKRFRFCDVASDIGFLAMDLDYMNNPYLSSYLILKYVEKSKDKGIFNVLNFYKSYRAYVRGKVNSFRLSEKIPEEEKRNIISTAKKYFDLSHYYACLFSLSKKPLLFIVCGLTGTGKSTVAKKISVDYGAHYLNTDIIRKELAGIDKFERHFDEYDKGLYSPEKVDSTYSKMIERAKELLKRRENVVLDATFQKKKHRNKAKEAAKESNALITFIKCVCPPPIVKERLDKRVKKKSISDGRWEIYCKQKETFEPFVADIEFDTSKGSYEYRMSFFRNLLNLVKGNC
jgi:hypothetical protein